ncbi:MAG: hypothetical protein IPO92_05315 [Saprospiraceae bacterium]|nr:hypothetical protein [Saprospiraceae bacterium]
MKRKTLKTNKVSEPAAIYHTKPKLTFYKDFDDMEKSRIEYVIQTDVVTRIKNTVDLIKRVFGEEKCRAGFSQKLYFK